MKSFLAIVFLLFSIGLQNVVHADSFGQAAVINGVGISSNRLQAMVDTEIAKQGVGSGGITQPKRYQSLQSKVLEKLISQEVLWQQAQKLNYVADEKSVDENFNQVRSGYDSDMAFKNKIMESGLNETKFREDIKQRLSISQMLKAEVEDKLEITQEDVESFYNKNPDKMKYPLALHARHILIKAQQDVSEEELAKARTRIGDLLVKIQQGADFAEIASAESEDSSASTGGDLGFFNPAQMVPEFAEAAMALKVGEVSEVIRTAFGFHIIKLEERRGGEALPIKDVEEQIRDFLKNQKANNAVVKYIEDLRDEADVEILVY